MSEEEKTAKVLQLFKDGSKPAPRRRPSAAKVTQLTVNGQVTGQVIGGDVHNHINEKKVVRKTVVRGPEFISPSGARKIKSRIDTLVKMDIAAGEPEEDKSKLYAKWWGILDSHFNVASYLEIRADQEQQALDWLQTLKVLKRPSIRRADNEMWRNDHYKGIWARARKAGKSKADVYEVVLERYGKRVASLKNLGERDLKALYTYIMNTWKEQP
ncbi:MAG: hypothetical protein PHW25_05330 [Zoogloea sp.]|uniref:hypothetical protein n=1 Tax=Zoogloea sp. TaxID=49181 RepID=UPI002635881D|nr:hypothetical protein [Zoogloea sp.]MDD3326492.1 hypothetical protein [Zoogloea sp.]